MFGRYFIVLYCFLLQTKCKSAGEEGKRGTGVDRVNLKTGEGNGALDQLGVPVTVINNA